MNENAIIHMMNSLDLTREEAIELLKEDEQVDKMTTKEVTSDLTAEQKKNIKAATITTSGKRSSTPQKRERKPDEIKREIIDTIAHNLDRSYWDDEKIFVHDISILKPEREITFKVGEDEYSIVLTKHRKAKGA